MSSAKFSTLQKRGTQGPAVLMAVSQTFKLCTPDGEKHVDTYHYLAGHPFIAEMNYDFRYGPTSPPQGSHEDPVRLKANAEKLKRLWNFAHAGGVERMQLNLEWLQAALADEPDDFDNKPLKKAIRETRKLIAILEGRKS